MKKNPVSMAEYSERLRSLIDERDSAFSQLNEFIMMATSGSDESLIDFGHEIKQKLSRMHYLISEIAVFSRRVESELPLNNILFLVISRQ